jgi:hypothetical protein
MACEEEVGDGGQNLCLISGFRKFVLCDAASSDNLRGISSTEGVI